MNWLDMILFGGGNGGGGGSGTTYTAGTGIGITDDEIRVTYGEDSYDDTPAFDGTMEQHGYTGFGTIYWGYAANDGDDPLTEDDYLKIVADASGEGLTFIDFANGDAYQQAVVTLIGMLPSNPPATMQYGIGVNCHGIHVAEDLSSVYLVSDASGTEQTEPAFVLGLATINGAPVIAILSNTNYVESGTYTITKGTPPLKLPDSAYDFGAVAVGDERPVNGDTVKAAINGTGNGITLTMDAAKNLTVALRDALGQTIESDTVNLPLESMVVGGRYADGVLYLTIIDQEEELEIPIADIVSGLVPDTRTVAGMPLSSNISASALAAIIGGELTHVTANWNDTNPDSAAYISNKPNIPSNANWNDKYTKPSGGIPASDIASGVIPTDVSDLNNDLNYATESFVNSSIATNTAFFRGTFESVSDLPSTNVSNNDYAFVISTTSGGDPEYDRYKYVVSGSSGAWQKEYMLNNSSFTAAQWAAIQSGITAQLVSKISGIPQNIVTGANGGSAIQIVVSSTAPASGTAGNILTLVTG